MAGMSDGCVAGMSDGCVAGMSDGCVVGMSDGCMVPRNVVWACVIEVSLACFVLPPQTLLPFHPVCTSSIGHQLPPGSYAWKMICGETGNDMVVMNRVFPILSEMPSCIVDHASPFHTLSGSLKRHAYIHLFGP